MRIHCFSGPFVLVLALWAPSASAFLDPPYITPGSPVAGEQVSVNIYGGECDLADDGVVWPPPVSQQGNDLTILFTGVHEEDPEWCYYGIGNATYPVGQYSAGGYTLHVERRYTSLLGWVHETLGVIPFTVSAVPAQFPIETPALNQAGFASLFLMLIAASLHMLRRKTRPQ
jgi:hypothetical protein